MALYFRVYENLYRYVSEHTLLLSIRLACKRALVLFRSVGAAGVLVPFLHASRALIVLLFRETPFVFQTAEALPRIFLQLFPYISTSILPLTFCYF